jgi:hypothetical protein
MWDRPKVSETTYARSIQTQEHIGKVDEHTWVWGAHRETTTINTSSHTRELWKSTKSNAVCMFFIEHLVASKHASVDAFSGWRRNYTIGVGSLGLDFAATSWKKVKGFSIGISTVAMQFGLEASTGVTECAIAATVSAKLGQVIETSNHLHKLELKLCEIEVEGTKTLTNLFKGKAKLTRIKAHAQATTAAGVDAHG